LITYRPNAKFNQDAAIVFFTQDQIERKNTHISQREILAQVKTLIDHKRFSGEKNQVFPIHHGKTLILLFGLGKEKELSKTSLRVACRKAFGSLYIKKLAAIEIIPPDISEDTVKGIIEGIILGTYVWNKYKTNGQKSQVPQRRDIAIIAPEKSVFLQTETICRGVNLSRDLINENADVADSIYLEKIIRQLVQGKKNVQLELLNRADLKRLGFGLHLAVNQGSRKEPKLIIVKYHGASTRSEPYVALLGKGMTYDTGGLNIKGSGSMEMMKMDMSGTAAVIGVLRSAVELKIKKNVLFACAIAENAIGSGAFKPGDVIVGHAGKSVEIANTDAEGRLILADAMSYIIKKYKPSRLIDIATLTGACVVALGHDYTGLVSPDDKLANELLECSVKTDDRAWRLPIYPELKEAVKSQIADIRNLGFPKGAAGTITAAEFLHQFSNGTRWAHLDIAGTAFVDGCERMYFGHGGTGAGVRLLTHYLQNY
jgi:leucyl aminopeptidase